MINQKTIEREAIYHLAEYLMQRGFKPVEAYKEAEKFWKKHKKKLKEVYG